MEQPLVAVCIVSTDEAENLVGVLGSLALSEHRRFAVFICENGGDAGFDRSAAALREAGLEAVSADQERCTFRLSPGGQTVVLINPGANRGYAGGTNVGIRAAASAEAFDAFWVLNPDTFPEPDALAALVRRQREGDYGMVGSRLIFVANGRVQMWGGFGWSNWLMKGRRPFGYLEPGDAAANVEQVEREMDVISGASMYATKAYVDEVGLMDEGFFVFCEDSDWCLRRGAYRLGYAHDSVIRHIHGSTSGSSLNRKKVSPFNIYLTARNRVRLAKKVLGRLWPVSAVLVFADLGRFLVRGTFQGYRIALRGWWAGVTGGEGPPPPLPRSVP